MVRLKQQQGFSIVEVLIGVALFTIIFLFIYQTLTLFFVNQNRMVESTQALYLAEAGHEYVRYMRDADWDSFTDLITGTTYYLAISTSTIATTTAPEVIDGKFTRSFVLRSAYRDSDDDLVASTTAGASVDPESFMVTTRVTWGDDREVRLQSFLGNLQNN